MSWSVATRADAGRSVAGVVPLALFPGLAAVCRRPLLLEQQRETISGAARAGSR